MFFFAMHFGWKLRELAVAITLDRISHRGEPHAFCGGGPPKGGLGESPFPPLERLLRKVKLKREAKEVKMLDKVKNSSNLSFFVFYGFCCVEIFEVATEKNFTATK